jgi:hypothetical protein
MLNVYFKSVFEIVLTFSVVQWSEFLATDPEVPSSISGATRFYEKQWVWNAGPLSLLRKIDGLLE